MAFLDLDDTVIDARHCATWEMWWAFRNYHGPEAAAIRTRILLPALDDPLRHLTWNPRVTLERHGFSCPQLVTAVQRRFHHTFFDPARRAGMLPLVGGLLLIDFLHLLGVEIRFLTMRSREEDVWVDGAATRSSAEHVLRRTWDSRYDQILYGPDLMMHPTIHWEVGATGEEPKATLVERYQASHTNAQPILFADNDPRHVASYARLAASRDLPVLHMAGNYPPTSPSIELSLAHMPAAERTTIVSIDQRTLRRALLRAAPSGWPRIRLRWRNFFYTLCYPETPLGRRFFGVDERQEVQWGTDTQSAMYQLFKSGHDLM